MKQKGFTLIELLAVIVVLAIIALIAIPIITNVIDKAKVGALKDSAYGILDAAEIYLAKNMSEGIDDTIEFTCSNGKCINGDKEISYKGQIETGRIRIYSDSKIELCITDNKYSALKRVTDKEVQVETGTCKYDELSYDVSALVSKDDYDNLKQELDEYKAKFNTETTATSEDILKGKTAYNNIGNLIEGSYTQEIRSMAETSTFTADTDDTCVLVATVGLSSVSDSSGSGTAILRIMKDGVEIARNSASIGSNRATLMVYKEVKLEIGSVYSISYSNSNWWIQNGNIRFLRINL